MVGVETFQAEVPNDSINDDSAIASSDCLENLASSFGVAQCIVDVVRLVGARNQAETVEVDALADAKGCSIIIMANIHANRLAIAQVGGVIVVGGSGRVAALDDGGVVDGWVSSLAGLNCSKQASLLRYDQEVE